VFSDAFVIKYFNGHLYVGGYQLALNGQIQAGYWVDGTFTQLYADPTITANIQDLTVSGSDVYVTGWIDSSYYSIPFYWKNGRVKVALAVGKGKVQFDKREDLKKRDSEREVKRATMHQLKRK